MDRMAALRHASLGIILALLARQSKAHYPVRIGRITPGVFRSTRAQAG